MAIVDCYTLQGSWPGAEADLSLEALAAGMQARGVGRSLVTHAAAIYYDTAVGNDLARQTCDPHEPLVPVGVVNPLKYPSCLDEIDLLLEQGVEVFRFCPREHGYPLSTAVGPLLETLERLAQAKLLLADAVGLPAPILAGDIIERIPVPLVLSVGADGLGTVIHAARRSPKIWVDTSSLRAGGAVEAAVRHLAADRVVFGSKAPLWSLGSAVMSVQYAELPEQERQAIFSGNLERVLGSAG